MVSILHTGYKFIAVSQVSKDEAPIEHRKTGLEASSLKNEGNLRF